MIIQIVENVFVVATLKVEGVPNVMHPAIGNDMSDGVIITKSNQKDYSAPFVREEEQCELLNVDAEFNGLSSSQLVISKEFTSKDEAKEYFSGISTVTIHDSILNKQYEATVMGVIEYDFYE